MLSVQDLTVEVAGQPVLEEATFTLFAGDKVGLVGRNGAGKTSLLKVLADEAPAAAGRVVRRGALGYLPQDPRLHDARVSATALTHVVSGRGLDEDAARLEKLRLQVEENPSMRNVTRYSRAEESFRVAGGYSAEATARRIAAGLGVGDDRLDLPVTALSGGERRRVELARILFAGSDLLLLDEPTNHLDTDAKAWLMKFLRSCRGALLVVSHDLYLLDEAITRVMHLDEERLIEYRGTYSQYRAARRRDEQRLTKVAARQQSEITRLRSLADSMRHQTQKRARTAKALDTRVRRLQESAVTPTAKERRVIVRFPDPPRTGRVILEAEQLAKGYGETQVFSDVGFWLERGERLLVLGLNGAGKTTLLRIIAGVLEPDAGTVTFGEGVSLGYYAQEHEGVIAGRDVLSHMRGKSSLPEQQLRALLGMFTLTGDRAFQDAGTLSGGEKTKLALAQLVAGRHNLLLLDEPTNNLDPPSLQAVADALSRWPGAMIIVSHDRDFVEALGPDRVLVMPEGSLDHWSDDMLELVALA